jgi:predicted RNase H-like HicB family nuclease
LAGGYSSVSRKYPSIESTIIVSFPEWEAHGLIGHTHGATYDEAVRNGQQALAMLVDSARHAGEVLPAPRTFAGAEQAS